MAGKGINTPAVVEQISAAEQLKQTGDVVKAMNAANRAAAQQEAESVIAPPTGDPSAVSAPVTTNLSFEDRLRDRYEREYAEEKRKEQERLQRERLGHGVAGLAASIGDMIRASEGAPVNPRDWQQIYDNLTAQERANVNNYQVRMAKLREDARADRKAAAAAAAQAEATKQQRDYEVVKDYIERNFKGDQAEKNRMLNWLLGTMRADTQIEVSKNRASGGGSTPKPVRFTAFGKSYDVIGDTKSFTNMMNDILTVLNNPANTAKDKTYKRITFKPDEIRTDPQGFYNRRVKELTGPESISQYTDSAIRQIDNIINAYKFGSEAGGTYGEKPTRQ